jgi:DNA-binding LacI/PurR family transcriptional regulator
LLDALQQNGLKPLMFYAASDEQVDALMSEALDWRTRGIIVAAGAIEPKRAAEVLDQGYFLAALNRSAHHPGAFSVATDNAAGGGEAAREFLADGRTRLLVVAGPEADWASSARTAGFLDALSPQGMTALVWNTAEMTNLSLPRGERPDAVFVTDDAMALGFIDGLRGQVDIPEQLAIIGFDNLPAAAWAPYRLTTFEQPLDELVGQIVTYIGQHDGQEPPTGRHQRDEKPILCAPRLIVRDTTRR